MADVEPKVNAGDEAQAEVGAAAPTEPAGQTQTQDTGAQQFDPYETYVRPFMPEEYGEQFSQLDEGGRRTLLNMARNLYAGINRKSEALAEERKALQSQAQPDREPPAETGNLGQMTPQQLDQYLNGLLDHREQERQLAGLKEKYGPWWDKYGAQVEDFYNNRPDRVSPEMILWGLMGPEAARQRAEGGEATTSPAPPPGRRALASGKGPSLRSLHDQMVTAQRRVDYERRVRPLGGPELEAAKNEAERLADAYLLAQQQEQGQT